MIIQARRGSEGHISSHLCTGKDLEQISQDGSIGEIRNHIHHAQLARLSQDKSTRR